MTKNILKIMRNECKSNILIGVELMIVGLFLWVIVDKTYSRTTQYSKPLSFDTEHTYIAHLDYLSEHSPMYQSDLSEEVQTQYLHTIMDRIAKYPGVEAVSASLHSSPHIGSNRSTTIGHDTISMNLLLRAVTPDFFKVFQWKSVNGSTDELVKALERGELIISPEVAKKLFPDGSNPVGQEIQLSFGRENQYGQKVGAVSTTIRYDNYIDYNEYFAEPFSEDYFKYLSGSHVSVVELCFRVSPDADHDFIPRFREEISEQLRLGNYFLSKVEYIPDNKRTFQADNRYILYRDGFMGFFLLVNILLGVVGVFWFRTQARVREMGVRIAFGDTPRQILRSYYAEGIILLFIALIPAIALMYYFTTIDFMVNEWITKYSFGRFLISYAITFVLLGLMIIIGIWFPARKVVRIPPAQALATE